MKKTLALLLAVAFAVPAFAGNILSNVETYGEIETIGFNATVDEMTAKTVVNRTLFGISADLVEDVRANLTFAYGSLLEDPVTGDSPWMNAWGSVYGVYGDSVDSYLQRISVAEANVVVSNIFGALEAKIGRQFYGNEDSAVMYFGPKRGNAMNLAMPTMLSLDGALLTWAGESAAVSAFYSQALEEDYLEAARITGLTFDYAFTNNLTAGVYWYDVEGDLEGTDEPMHLGIWGGKVAYQNENAKIGVEYAKNYLGHVFGHNNEGWMLKADAALNLDTEAVALTPRLTYYHSEKGFVAFGNYNPGIILGNVKGAMFGFNPDILDTVDWRIFNAGIDFGMKSLEKVTFSFDYLNAKLDNSWVGNEFDLTAKYHHNDYVTFTLGGAMATNLMADMDDIYGVQLGMLIKF